MRQTPVETVTTSPALDVVVDAARTAGRLGLDTEFLREKTYKPKLCLVQVAVPQRVYLIDPLESVELRPLADLVGDPDVETIVHAGRQDLELFHDGFGVVPRNVLDVQVAAGFAGLSANLPYGRLMESLLGVRLTKGEAYSDWCKRPLSKSQLSYAANDVAYLLDAADAIKGKLVELGRLEWARAELASLEDAESYEFRPYEVWKRVSGRGTLSGPQLGVLREVAAWREETCVRRDLPRGWVVKDPTLVEIARRQPRSTGELKSIRGFNAREAEKSGRELLAAVQRGRSAPPIEQGPSWPRLAQTRARVLAGPADALIRSRSEAAGVAPELVTTRAEMESLLAAVYSGSVEPSQHRLLQGWRRELAGDAILALAEGRVAIRAIDSPPYIEEVPV